MERYLPTGSEQVSLPRVNEINAGVEDLTFLHMASRGLIDLRGGQLEPLMRPFVAQQGVEAELGGFEWSRLGYWYPRFAARAGALGLEGVILTPVGERGFGYRLRLTNNGAETVETAFGLRGQTGSAWHCVNVDKPIEGALNCYVSGWSGLPVFEQMCGVPLFALAPICEGECRAEFEPAGEGWLWRLERTVRLAPGESAEFTAWWGLGLEEVSAVTSARELQRRGWDWELRRSLAWLAQRSLDLGDEALTRLYNTNLFFCIFFSTGRTLDTEELVLVTSRSPRYYVSAAYWDRDSLLWSFPAVLDADAALAREMLGYVFGRQRRNIGVHSRFIDGTVLEPGFELDELMAPVLALERYVGATCDRSVLADPDVLRGIDGILRKLDAERAEDCELYETFLQPTDDERVYPYITYDNVLVWRALRALGRLFERPELTERAERVRRAIYDNCIFDGDFAWSVDLAGGHDVYDEPPGSLLLLPYYGFCAWDDPVYLKTAEMIRSPDYAYSFAGCEIAEIGCPHAPHPWLLSIGNSLLCGRSGEALEHLRRTRLDNGIACESVDEHTGECTTGEAFATCAGFICHALRRAIGGERREG
ncbi:MAG: glycoside hydrolase family 125 protein [Firmicutes bacterium]|nr:glycoside hydrolase family 125 protein [Bacillota bacterium]